MVKNSHRILWPGIILIFFLIVGSSASAALPASQGFVNDFANVLDQKSKAEL